jgi:ABC-type Fe3+ transport system permease subunit
MYLLSSLIGYGLPIGRQFRSIDFRVVAVSVFEPVGSAWLALALTLICSYPARRTRAMPYLTLISLLLFCVPAAIYAIGWIDLGQKLGGLAIAPVVAHASRAVALCVLGFAVGYSRLPTSLENAAQLVRVSSVTRAAVFVLPIIAGSLIASSALAAALTYSDRDVASLLLAPGASRLTLNLYLASANAPSSTISLLAFAVLGGAALTLILAAAGPALLWRKRA